jgi:hypothetical protein
MKAFIPAIMLQPRQNRSVILLLEIVTDQKNQYRQTASHPTPIAICTRVPVGAMRHNLSRLSRCSSCALQLTPPASAPPRAEPVRVR